jgi:hypothetical protein
MDTNTLPPIDWFRDPGVTKMEPHLRVTDDGHVYGLLAEWDRAHIGFSGQLINPPRSRSDYSYFHTGAIDVIDGDTKREISVGVLTMNTGHAETTLGHRATVAHYDNSGSVAAYVCAGESEHGIWVSGALEPGMDEVSRRRFRACGLSGDWRKIGTGLELVAALSVPTAGFPIPRARVASGSPIALVAAGAVQPAVSFGRRVVDGWVAPKVEAPALDVDSLADALAVKLEERRTAGELSARHTALVSELDDTPVVAAALLQELDDSPARAAALFAELADDEDDFISNLPPQLKEEWLHGKIAARIVYGAPGQFARCQAIAREKGIAGRYIDGMCANLIREATGKNPGDHD